MQPVHGDQTIRTSDRLARFVQQRILWLLLGCYAIAALWPQPGILLRQWEWRTAIWMNVPLTLSLLLLAVMLFVAAILTDVTQVRQVFQHPLGLGIALAAVWLGPALLVAAAGWAVPWAVGRQEATGLLVGLALVAAMPVANSCVGWIQNASGNLAWGLALVVISISLSPWVTPRLLATLGMTLSPQERAYCEQLVVHFSGIFFIIWVLLPTAAGFAARHLLTPARIATASNWLTLTSAAALLSLNYINSAIALPSVLKSPSALLAMAATLAAALSVVGLVIGWGIARLLRQPSETRTALVFGLSMKHTGLALILAGAVLREEPLAMLMIVLATLMQHVLAGLVQAWQDKESRRAEQ